MSSTLTNAKKNAKRRPASNAMAAHPTAAQLKAMIRRYLQKNVPQTYLDTDYISVTLWRDCGGRDVISFDGPGPGPKLAPHVSNDDDLADFRNDPRYS